ncbi:MAG: glycosyltransferase family 39 protein, partial [Rhodospirillaceae bacterium]|nr:glycosyltransferase family 39 protein [Rhodospirillaceae bacterium]
FVAGQGLLDAGTCALIAAIAGQFTRRWALWSGLAAAFTPTLIVVAGLVYTDTIFVFFATLALYAALRWLKAPSWRWAITLGLALGLAALTRALIVLWVPALLAYLAAVLLIRRQLGRTRILQLVCAAAALAACLAPSIARNVVLYEAWSITPQGGIHLSHWVLPLVREGADGTARDKTNAATDAALKRRFPAYPTPNPFVNSAMMSAYARDELARLGWKAVARAWAFGAAINLSAPAVVHVPPVSNLPRTGFYDTPGATFLDKLENFLFGAGNRLYAWLLAAGLIGVVLFRLVQLVGLAALLRQRGAIPGALLLAGWCLYILAVNGPIASPKYRLPLEPAFAVLSGAGLATLMGRRRRASRRA